MLNIAIHDLCKFIRGELGTVPRMYMQLLTSYGYVKGPVYDPTGKILREAPLTVTGRKVPEIKRAVEFATQQKKEEEASQKARRIVRERRPHRNRRNTDLGL